MTRDEIKQLIAEKISGQGTNVDAASVLPSILEAIIDIIPQGGGYSEQIEMSLGGELFEGKTAQEAAEIFGISEDELERLTRGKYCSALLKEVAESYLIIVASDGAKVYFLSGDAQGFGVTYILSYSNGLYSLNEA